MYMDDKEDDYVSEDHISNTRIKNTQQHSIPSWEDSLQGYIIIWLGIFPDEVFDAYLYIKFG